MMTSRSRLTEADIRRLVKAEDEEERAQLALLQDARGLGVRFSQQQQQQHLQPQQQPQQAYFTQGAGAGGGASVYGTRSLPGRQQLPQAQLKSSMVVSGRARELCWRPLIEWISALPVRRSRVVTG